MIASGILGWAVSLALLMLTAALILTFVRLVRGPSLPDRVVALDLVTSISVGVIAIDAIASEQPAFLDAASVVALITFLGTVAYARYLERRGRDE
jgi:multicomponent Na+:H+ antiporter subunit F